MLPELDDGNWKEAFGYAGEPKACGGPKVTLAHPQRPVSLDPFQRSDVVVLVASKEGCHDEDDWLCVGVLRDGRAFALKAGCDYTGWD